MKSVLEASRCHTLDRHNWRAQQDKCGSVDVKVWEKAVQANFTLDHWPYENADEETKQCVQELSMNSLYNLKKGNAAALIVSLLGLNLYLLA